ncbi:DUF1656 domain-containing protein [Novosphingobium aerophilum]|uniref:DUF1656 domain-containing protein n=1 Tax=Novosphingobium TaxID=165696 RepID=UPI0006C8BE92|nr:MULTISPECIES: DUF1656 domain-containing protein [unclassified Novosphingobium]KPH63052.1 hypothetical protein ADT71_14175 [Novosphingobium sp. ST904]MPS69367.1 DUF1656 domain-containing protein [Novosphingobium sp.]TCM32510.1 uncharacterized protein DUF1656 [Novosphingobium sp. ST904]WRT91818.1 DUF1656 domain-containing protein [Novosphingobium sp. RL4]
MRGEVSIDGVFLPTLLVLAVIASVITLVLMRIANVIGFYRLFAYRAAVDLCLYILVLGLLVWASPLIGFRQ